MEERKLLVYDSNVMHTVLFVFAIVTVALPTALWGFVLGIWSARLRFVLEQIADFAVRCVMGLQGICILAYAIPGWTSASSSFLRCAESWVWFDYFDGVIEDSQDVSYTESLPDDLHSFTFTHWSRTYYGNGFTATAAVILCLCVFLLYYLLARYCCGWKCRWLQMDPLVKTIQLVHLRLSLSLLLEIRLLNDGKTPHWSSGTGIAFSFLIVFILPAILLITTLIKHPSALEQDDMKQIYGSLYREYRGSCKAVYMHFAYAENLLLAIAVCILGQWREAQSYLIVAILAVSWAEIVIFRPYRLFEHNIFDSILRLLRLFLGILLVVIYSEADLSAEEQSFIVFILVLVWMFVQLVYGVTVGLVSLRHVRSFFTDETFEDFLYEQPHAQTLDPSPIPKKGDNSPFDHVHSPTSAPKEGSETLSRPHSDDQAS